VPFRQSFSNGAFNEAFLSMKGRVKIRGAAVGRQAKEEEIGPI
jgi:hypothetical protein